MFSDSLAITPLAVCLPNQTKAVVMETAVENYPGMFLYRNGETPANTLLTDFAPLPLETIVGGFDRLNLLPVKRADYIADLKPLQQLPWRMVLVTTEDTQLLDTDTPFCLAPECRITDTSWIKPGKVAWDWWNNWTPRTLTLDLSKFLTSPAQLDCFADGVNADREATDYRHLKQQVSPTTTLTVQLAPGGGWAGVIK